MPSATLIVTLLQKMRLLQRGISKERIHFLFVDRDLITTLPFHFLANHPTSTKRGSIIKPAKQRIDKAVEDGNRKGHKTK